jgi:hypothetical protein
MFRIVNREPWKKNGGGGGDGEKGEEERGDFVGISVCGEQCLPVLFPVLYNHNHKISDMFNKRVYTMRLPRVHYC